MNIVGRRLRAHLIRSSAMLAAMAAAGAAQAQSCSPLPTSPNTTTTCTGNVSGVTATATSNTIVVADAILTTNGTAAFTANNTTSNFGINANLRIDGVVDGGSTPGVLIQSGPSNRSTRSDIVVGQTGVVRGQWAILLQPTTGQTGLATATLDNSGSVTSTSIQAVTATITVGGSGSRGVFFDINNRSTGFIGGISAPVGTLTNAGIIEGGSAVALNSIAPAVTNSGEIRANTVGSTINMLGNGLTLTNTGAVRNIGLGNAITALNSTITNSATGVISSRLAAAIQIDGDLTLTNRGLITGSVTATGASNIDTVGGAINGDVLLGAGDDFVGATLNAAYTGLSEISGRLDGGGGVNTLRLDVESSGSLNSFVAPTAFQNIQLRLNNDAAVTRSVATTTGLGLRGRGSFTNLGAVNTAGPAFFVTTAPNSLNNGTTFTNRSTITANINGQPNRYAIELGAVSGFTNEGAVTGVNGGGVSVTMSNQGSIFLNSGTITASGRALNLSSGTGTNTGSIRSTAADGAFLSLGGGTVLTSNFTNQGTIEGITAGAVVNNIVLVNSGQVRATNGAGALLSGYSTLDNRAGGIVSGTTAGVASTTNHGAVFNAGVINGDVDFRGNPQIATEDWYVDNGGTVTGSVFLGNGNDYLMVDPSRISNGRLVGVSGSVDAGAGTDTLVYAIRSNTSLSIAATPGLETFEDVAFELMDGATATVSITQARTSRLRVGGIGTIDLTATIGTTDSELLNLQGVDFQGRLGQYTGITNRVNVINRGTLTATLGSNFVSNALSLTSGDFTNAGSITVTGAGSSKTAIAGGAVVTNTGTTTVNNAVAVADAASLVNSGSITQTGGGAAVGVVSVQSVNNSGRIDMTGDAIRYPAFPFGAQPPMTVTNQSGGLIRSTTGAAIRSSATTADRFRNEGQVIGLVDLGAGADVVENFGTITGNVILGAGDDTFVQGGTVTGTIDGGTGIDTYTLDGTLSSTPNFANVVNFENLAMGSGTSRLAGALAFNQITVNSGNLFGLAGSTLTAPRIDVGAGGTFGSAGTVNANVFIAGTLAPGASPGVMTVNGNVSFLTGSTALFELATPVSDQLLVSGAVTIAPGSTLRLVGAPAPGARLDLIVAGGGITGSFSTIEQAATAAGAITQLPDRIQFVGLFLDASLGVGNQALAIDYINDAIAQGGLNAELTAAFPALTSADGAANPLAFQRISPEAYASAGQLAAENGLILARASRSARGVPTKPGAFTYGQALHASRDIGGQASSGSAAEIKSFGGMAGFGLAAENGWVGAFAGGLDGEQRLAVLGARTEARDLVVGVQGQAITGGFTAGLMMAFDRSEADTRRVLPGGASASGAFGMRSLIGDAHVAYEWPVGDGWSLRPQIGATYVRTTRNGVSESGGGVFALTVRGDTASRWFIDGEIALVGEMGAVRPYAAVGVRQTDDGVRDLASASFAGLNRYFDGSGVVREQTATTAAAGFSYQAGESWVLTADYFGEFGGGDAHTLAVGASLRF